MKWAISEHEMGNIGKRNERFRTMLWGISQCCMMKNRLHYA